MVKWKLAPSTKVTRDPTLWYKAGRSHENSIDEKYSISFNRQCGTASRDYSTVAF